MLLVLCHSRLCVEAETVMRSADGAVSFPHAFGGNPTLCVALECFR